MISKCLMTTLLLLVDVKLLGCAGRTIYIRNDEHCKFIPASMHQETIHYLLGDKIQIKVWCTTADSLLGGPQAKYARFKTGRAKYDFYLHNNDTNKGFTLDFHLVRMKKVVDGLGFSNATTTLTIDPALMLYHYERLYARLFAVVELYSHWIIQWVDIHIVQLKRESHNVIVANTCPNVTLFCELEYPVVPERQPVYEWAKIEGDRRIALPNNDTYVIGNDGTLVIDPLPHEDQGFYECSLHFVEDTDEVTEQRTPSYIHLTITEPNEDDLERPECYKPPPTTPPPTTEGITEPMNATTANPNYIEGIEYVDIAFVGVLILGIIYVTAAALYRITRRAPAPRHNAFALSTHHRR